MCVCVSACIDSYSFLFSRMDVHNMHFIERVQVKMKMKRRKCQSKEIYREEKSDNISYHQAFISYMSCINLHDISLAQQAEEGKEYE